MYIVFLFYVGVIQLLQSAQNNITARKRVLVIGDFGKNVNMLNGKLG